MPLFRRPLLRGAMVAGAGYAAGRSNAMRHEHEAAQEERLNSLEAQSYGEPAPAHSDMSIKAEELTKLKQLLDAQILTQEEFDAQKQQILAS